jgi:hypothetical protein
LTRARQRHPNRAEICHIVQHVVVLHRMLRDTNLLWVRTFDTVEELRQALLAFREVYNTTWLIERHGFRPPAAIRAEQLPPAAKAA